MRFTYVVNIYKAISQVLIQITVLYGDGNENVLWTVNQEGCGRHISSLWSQ